jgi:hypothetical protein
MLFEAIASSRTPIPWWDDKGAKRGDSGTRGIKKVINTVVNRN